MTAFDQMVAATVEYKRAAGVAAVQENLAADQAAQRAYRQAHPELFPDVRAQREREQKAVEQAERRARFWHSRTPCWPTRTCRRNTATPSCWAG